MIQDDAHTPQILVVENNNEVLSLVSTMVSTLGWSAVSATSLEEARHVLSEGRIDVIITDLVLDDGDGLDLLRGLRAQGETMPAVMISSYASPEMRTTAQEAGATDLLAKPFRMERLSTLLQKIIAEHGLHTAPAV